MGEPRLHSHHWVYRRRGAGPESAPAEIRQARWRLLQASVGHHPLRTGMGRSDHQPTQGWDVLRSPQSHHAGAFREGGNHPLRRHRAGHQRAQAGPESAAKLGGRLPLPGDQRALWHLPGQRGWQPADRRQPRGGEDAGLQLGGGGAGPGPRHRPSFQSHGTRQGGGDGGPGRILPTSRNRLEAQGRQDDHRVRLGARRAGWGRRAAL